MPDYSRVVADAGACIGAGNCLSFAPDVFDQDADGVVVVRRAEVTGEQAEQAAEAAENCPAFAIMIERISDKI
jgi:ferredoxin